MEPESDPYAVLGVPRDATAAAIKTAYRKLVLKWHPDKCVDEERRSQVADFFYRLLEAYEVLGDEDRRLRYDAQVRLAQLKADSLPAPQEHLRSKTRHVRQERQINRKMSESSSQDSPTARRKSGVPLRRFKDDTNPATSRDHRPARGYASQASSCSSAGSTTQRRPRRGAHSRHGHWNHSPTSKLSAAGLSAKSKAPAKNNDYFERRSRLRNASKEDAQSSHDAVVTWLNSLEQWQDPRGHAHCEDNYLKFDRMVSSEVLSSPLRLQNLAWRHESVRLKARQHRGPPHVPEIPSHKAASDVPTAPEDAHPVAPVFLTPEYGSSGTSSGSYDGLCEVPLLGPISSIEMRTAAAITRFLKWLRPRPSPGHMRYEWMCTCGKLMYGDYLHSTPHEGQMSDFSSIINATRPGRASFASLIGNRNRKILFSGLVVLRREVRHLFNQTANAMFWAEAARWCERSSPGSGRRNKISEPDSSSHPNAASRYFVDDMLVRQFAIALVYLLMTVHTTGGSTTVIQNTTGKSAQYLDDNILAGVLTLSELTTPHQGRPLRV